MWHLIGMLLVLKFQDETSRLQVTSLCMIAALHTSAICASPLVLLPLPSPLGQGALVSPPLQ